eukprot:11714492-Karenia_brevis.AAC.1
MCDIQEEYLQVPGFDRCVACKLEKPAEEFTRSKRASKMSNDKDLLICLKCNALKVRCCRVVLRRGYSTFGFEKMRPENRVDFYRKNADSYADALEARMQEQMIEITKKESTVEMVGTGEWLDESDLKEAYKDKPEQYEHVKANTRTMTDSCRGVVLFENMKYSTRTRDAESNYTEEQRQWHILKDVMKGKEDPFNLH